MILRMHFRSDDESLLFAFGDRVRRLAKQIPGSSKLDANFPLSVYSENGKDLPDSELPFDDDLPF